MVLSNCFATEKKAAENYKPNNPQIIPQTLKSTSILKINCSVHSMKAFNNMHEAPWPLKTESTGALHAARSNVRLWLNQGDFAVEWLRKVNWRYPANVLKTFFLCKFILTSDFCGERAWFFFVVTAMLVWRTASSIIKTNSGLGKVELTTKVGTYGARHLETQCFFWLLI